MYMFLKNASVTPANIKFQARFTWGLLAGLAAMMLPLVMLPGSAFGHGKEITLKVSTISAATDPMSKDFTVKATYADGDPADAAKIEISGMGPGGASAGPEPLVFRGNGVYTGSVRLRVPGDWKMQAKVVSGGTANLAFSETVSEPLGTQKPPTSGQEPDSSVISPQEPRQKEMTETLSFSGRDAANLAVRVLHVIGAVAWIGGLLFMVLVFGPVAYSLEEKSGPALISAYTRFGLIALIGLAVLLLTGIYNLMSNLPNSAEGAGGIRDIESLVAQPYGETYLTLLITKIAIFVVMIGIAGFLKAKWIPQFQGVIDREQENTEEISKVAARGRMLTITNLVLGLTVIVLSASMTYLHIIGHAARAALGHG